eukprot:828719-Rhodomonas_salina.2
MEGVDAHCNADHVIAASLSRDLTEASRDPQYCSDAQALADTRAAPTGCVFKRVSNSETTHRSHDSAPRPTATNLRNSATSSKLAEANYMSR